MCDYLLPIGSIVRLTGSEKYVMIYGVKQKTSFNPEIMIDYVAVPYPEGYFSEKYQYIFNQDDIEEVIFRGYEDDSREVFIKLLDYQLNNKQQ